MNGTKIYYALDRNQDPVDIKSASSDENYYCIGCGKRLTIKAEYSTRVHKYFSHLPGAECNYAETHDMSEWHYMWQSRFPGCCEIPMPNKANPIHRADVCIWGRVIEFQHSPINEEEFKSRNEFYPLQIIGLPYLAGYLNIKCSLIWVFDMNEHVKKIENGCIKLKKRNDLFRGYNVNLSGYALFFEFEDKLYQIASMDEKTGTYNLAGEVIIDKDTFTNRMRKAPTVSIQKAPTKSNSKMQLTNKTTFPGYKKAIRRGFNGCF